MKHLNSNSLCSKPHEALCMSLDFFFFFFTWGSETCRKRIENTDVSGPFQPFGRPLFPFRTPVRAPPLPPWVETAHFQSGLRRNQTRRRFPISPFIKHDFLSAIHSDQMDSGAPADTTKYIQPPRWEKKLFNINPIIGKKNVQVRCPCIRRWRSCGRSSPLRYLPQVHPVNVT